MVERDDVVQVRVHECRVVRLDLGRGVAKRVARVKVPEDVRLVPCSNGRERALVLAVRCAAVKHAGRRVMSVDHKALTKDRGPEQKLTRERGRRRGSC